MSYRRFVPVRPNCIYCGKPVDSGAFDGESGSWFSYGSQCMLDNPKGRFVVVRTEPDGTRTITHRLATMKRAESVADYYAAANRHLIRQGWKWEAVDTGTGFVAECEPD